MLHLLQISAITSIWVLGLTIVTQDQMLFGWVRRLAESKGGKIMEPLILCHWCMPSIHSLVGYIFAFCIGIETKLSFALIAMYPLVVMLSSLTCGMTWTLYLLMDANISHLQNKKNDQEN